MASLHVTLLALSIHERDARKRATRYMLDHYYISWSSRQSDSIRRAKRKRVVQQILLYQNFLSLIALLHGRAPGRKLRSAHRIFRFPGQVVDAQLASFATDG